MLKIVFILIEKNKGRKPTKFPLTDESFSCSTSTPRNREFSSKKESNC